MRTTTHDLTLSAALLPGPDSILQANQSALEVIAMQCPLAGGPAVYTARSLYAPFDAEISYDDVVTCFESGYAFRPGKEQPKAEVTDMVLMPNPAKSEVTISLPTDFEGEIRLISVAGTVVKTVQVAGNTAHVISLENLPVGVYTCMAKGGTGATYTAKLVILP